MFRPTATPRVALIAALLLIVAACGGGASPSASAAAASTAPSPNASAASGEPSSQASGGFSFPPIASLPSVDKELEARLPSELCGGPADKLSIPGTAFVSQAEPEFAATVARLGKSPADVVVAGANGPFQVDGPCNETVAIVRVKGADPAQLQTVFVEEARKDGPVDQKSLGGKNIFFDAASGDFYVYFVGDAMFIVTAPDEATAAEILAQLA
jgi:hypothetical protein